MLFNHRYHGNSKVASSAANTEMSFAPDTHREPTFFVGELGQHLNFREAISSLHDVVISDMRFKPRDKTDYMTWLKENEQQLLADWLDVRVDDLARITDVRSELNALYKTRRHVMKPFYSAQQKYFDYLYKYDYDAWFVLDPVITINPDQIFFECFSQDESSYGRLSCNYEVFKSIDSFACGTTNIDYSNDLYNEFQKIRDYKNTRFKVEPDGFEVTTHNDDSFVENKIDLPDSWVRGFLQVSSAMTMPMRTLTLHPMDMYNICLILKRKKEKIGPRSIRFILRPGQAVKIIFEPWNTELICKRSCYEGEADEIRMWGRRRLSILERLIPVTKKFTVNLLGTGMPSFFIAHMNDMDFTLGLSGWTANDWSRLGNFDLMAPRVEADDITKKRVFNALKENWVESVASLAKRLNLNKAIVAGSLQAYTQAGRVVYDLVNKVYRVRELSKDPLPMKMLRFSNEREDRASNFVNAGLVKIKERMIQENALHIRGTVMDDGRKYETSIVIDDDQRLSEAECECHFFVRNRLYEGPCEHMLALRIKHNETSRKI